MPCKEEDHSEYSSSDENKDDNWDVDSSSEPEGDDEDDVDYVIPTAKDKGKKKKSGNGKKTTRSKKINECKVCKLVFKDSDELNDHESTHDEKPTERDLTKCKKCDQLFLTPHELKSHTKKEHADVNAVHKCSKCDKSFGSKVNLKRHLAVHERHENGGGKKTISMHYM